MNLISETAVVQKTKSTFFNMVSLLFKRVRWCHLITLFLPQIILKFIYYYRKQMNLNGILLILTVMMSKY